MKYLNIAFNGPTADKTKNFDPIPIFEEALAKRRSIKNFEIQFDCHPFRPYLEVLQQISDRCATAPSLGLTVDMDVDRILHTRHPRGPEFALSTKCPCLEGRENRTIDNYGSTHAGEESATSLPLPING